MISPTTLFTSLKSITIPSLSNFSALKTTWTFQLCPWSFSHCPLYSRRLCAAEKSVSTTSSNTPMHRKRSYFVVVQISLTKNLITHGNKSQGISDCSHRLKRSLEKNIG